MQHISLNAEIVFRKDYKPFALCPARYILEITDCFGIYAVFSSRNEEKISKYIVKYFEDFDNYSTVTSKQILSNTGSKYYKYIDQFIESKTYTNDILLSELINVKGLNIKHISLNKNVEIETNKTNSTVYKAFDIFSFLYGDIDASFGVLSSNTHNNAIPLFEDTYKKISRYCELGVRWDKRSYSFVVEIVACRFFDTLYGYPVFIDIDYDVKLINNDALITVNVTETAIGYVHTK